MKPLTYDDKCEPRNPCDEECINSPEDGGCDCCLAATKKRLEEMVNFCLSKCGGGYCSYMTDKVGFPCLEFVCAFCAHSDEDEYCKFCRGEADFV